ncbi:MAG: hypothetical protein P1U86_02910 [Verrucomicrobiales bacterium]|nr:hypothetical protein [Verrucomicrobiales bacterium]
MRFVHLHFLFLLFASGLPAGGLLAQDQSDEQPKLVMPVEDGASLSADEAYEEAIKDFTSGSYDDAEAKFLTLVKRGLISKELYFNLGTTLEKKDEAGRAALWMRRALLLAPGMVEPRQNLVYLKKKLGYLEFADEGAEALFRNLPPTVGDWIAMTGLWLVAICLAMAFLLPRYQERRFRPLLFACLAAILAFGGAWFSQHYARHYAIENFATVTAKGATALTSPVPDAKAVIDLPPGSEVRILQETGPWTYVEIPGEIRGWLRNEQLAAVWPITFR